MSEIVRMILKSGIIDPQDNHSNVVEWKRNGSCNGLAYKIHTRKIINSMNVLTQLLITQFHNQVMDILTEANINESFPSPNRFNVDIGAVQRALKRSQ